MVSRAKAKKYLTQMIEDLYNTGQCTVSERALKDIVVIIEDMELQLMERKKEITRLRNMVGE